MDQKKGNMNEQNGEMLRVECYGGKYTVIQDKTGRVSALRYGEQWRECVGDGLILGLAQDLDAERTKSFTKLGVSGILFWNQAVLVGQRPEGDSAGGKWVTPGGGVELFESYDTALIREYYEETGLHIAPHKSSVVEEIVDQPKTHVVMIFKYVDLVRGSFNYDPAGWPVTRTSEELPRLKWVFADEAMQMIRDKSMSYMTAAALRDIKFI